MAGTTKYYFVYGFHAFWVAGFGLRVSGFGFRVPCSVLKISSKFLGHSYVLRVSGFGFRVSC
jgi:hypothetical protein